MENDSESPGYSRHRGIYGPKLRPRRHETRGQQVGVRQANSLRIEGTLFNHVPNFAEFRHLNFDQSFHIIKALTTLTQRTESDLSDDKGVHHDLSLAETFLHLWIALAKKVDPDGCVGQDHTRPTRTRLMSCKSGSVPPTAARRLEALR